MDVLAWMGVVFNAINILSGNVLFIRFLRTRKFNTMLFFATVPMGIVFGLAVYFLSGIENYSGQTAGIVKTALNISQNNTNKYLWIGVVGVVYIIVMFLTFTLLSFPIKKVENAVRRLSYGEVKDRIDIGGNKQFLEIEHSLNRINQNLKIKDYQINQSKIVYKKYLPKNILKSLGKESIISLREGNQIKKNVSLLYFSIKNTDFVRELSVSKSLTKYLSLASSITQKYNGYVDKYLNESILCIFVNCQDAINCAKSISKSCESFKTKNNKNAIDYSIVVDVAEVEIGLIEESNKHSYSIITNFDSMSENLDNLILAYDTKFIFSKDVLNNLPSKYKITYRYIGDAIIKGNITTPIFECLDIYSKQKIEKIKKAYCYFENAVRLYQNNKISEAKNLFEKIYKDEKDDKICYGYYNKCCEAINKFVQ